MIDKTDFIKNSNNNSTTDTYSCDYTNKLIKTTKTTSNNNTYSCTYINNLLNGVCPASFNDKSSINITSVNGYGVVVLFSSMYGAVIQFQGSGNNPNVITIYGTTSFTTSASGNVVTLSSLNTWDHYIMFGSNAISKIE